MHLLRRLADTNRSCAGVLARLEASFGKIEEEVTCSPAASPRWSPRKLLTSFNHKNDGHSRVVSLVPYAMRLSGESVPVHEAAWVCDCVEWCGGVWCDDTV